MKTKCLMLGGSPRPHDSLLFEVVEEGSGEDGCPGGRLAGHTSYTGAAREGDVKVPSSSSLGCINSFPEGVFNTIPIENGLASTCHGWT